MAEQLRTIHMTLLLIALILIATVFAAQKGPFKTALNDVISIESLTSRGSEFKLKAIAQVTSAMSASLTAADYEKLIQQRMANFPYVQEVVNGTVVSSMDRTEEFLYGAFKPSATDHLTPLSEMEVEMVWFSNLSDFIRKWDEPLKVIRNPLLTDKRFDSPDQLPNICPGKTILKPSQTAPGSTSEAAPIYYFDPVEGLNLTVQVPQPRDAVSHVERPCWQKVPVQFDGSIDFDSREIYREIAKRPDWAKTDFSESFSALDEVTKYLKSVDLADLENYLREEINREEEKVEIVGAKIPFELVSGFGSVILLACQFYLWCHLTEFANRLGYGLEEELTGYIGFYYDQPIVKVFILLSVSVIPAAVLIFTISKTWGNKLAWAPVVCLPLSIVLGCLLVRAFYTLWAVLEPPQA